MENFLVGRIDLILISKSSYVFQVKSNNILILSILYI